MARRKNTRRFDPRYFMDEKTDIIKENRGKYQLESAIYMALRDYRATEQNPTPLSAIFDSSDCYFCARIFLWWINSDQ